MRPKMSLCFVLLALMTAGAALSQRQSAPNRVPAHCAVTLPNGRGPLGWNNSDFYGSGVISAYISPEGTVVFEPGGPGFVTHDGSLGMKWGWWRGVRGQLEIEGHRL